MSTSRSRRQVFFGLPPFSCLGGSTYGYVCAWLSQDVAKPSAYRLKDLYLYLGLVCSIPVVFVAHPVHPVYSQNSLQAMVDKCPYSYQRGLVYSPRTPDFTLVLNMRILVVSPITFDFHTFLNRWKATLSVVPTSVPLCVSSIIIIMINFYGAYILGNLSSEAQKKQNH